MAARIVNPELSRRAARVMRFEPIRSYTAAEGQAFCSAIARAGGFDDLPVRYQQAIAEAEYHLKRAILGQERV